MDSAAVIERVQRVAATRADASAVLSELQSALVDLHSVRSFLDAAEAELSRRVAAGSSFPEAALAESSRGSLIGASKTLERAATLDAAPALAAALDAAQVTAGHIDALTRATKGLEAEQAALLVDRIDGLVDVAAVASVEEFGKRVRTEASRILADDGFDRFTRQQRDTSLSTWVDPEGMWNLRGRFDPLTGVKLAARLDTAVDALFAEATPDTCPSDPVAKQRHLRALAMAALVDRGGVGRRGGRPEFVAVIDVAADARVPGSATDPFGSPDTSCSGSRPVQVDWPVPVEIPHRVLTEMLDDAAIASVVVRDGVVLHAPGELNLGRSTRLANRAQRRALHGLYATCAIPGCATRYDRCKLHHVVWWRHGGRTDIDNLLPVCSQHHHKIHDGDWNVELGSHRELTIRFPDGTVRNTGPPSRNAA